MEPTADTVPLEWTEHELLTDPEIAEPLVVAGRRCHGGYASDGTYRSPRTAVRVPAIAAWQAAHRAAFGTEILDAPLHLWPSVYPNVDQSRLLLRAGVRDAFLGTLTRVGTIEGFGGLIREWGCGDVQRHVVEPLRGTALAHLQSGLFEAHARDETGHDGVAGHREMWFAARDLANGRAVTDDEAAEYLRRTAIAPVGRTVAVDERLVPEIDAAFEAMLRRMIGLMLIEVSAFHTFAWAEALLADTELLDGDGAAASVVAHIRADETPHVDYLRTALTEVRDRTVRTVDGATIPGAVVVARLYEPALAASLGERRRQQVAAADAEVAMALDGRADAAELLAEFQSLSAA